MIFLHMGMAQAWFPLTFLQYLSLWLRLAGFKQSSHVLRLVDLMSTIP